MVLLIKARKKKVDSAQNDCNRHTADREVFPEMKYHAKIAPYHAIKTVKHC